MKILYVHGFGSSGQTGTVRLIRGAMPEAEVLAPDLPVHPAEALALLRQTVADWRPDIVIGTSMGGMYAEQLGGVPRILVNPAFEMGDTLKSRLGKVEFSNPRADGVQSFIMTRALLQEYVEACRGCFAGADAGERRIVWGLFGREDPIVHTHDLFAAHYPNAVWFHGEHRLDDHTLLHTVVPIVRWLRDQTLGRQRDIVYICVEHTLRRGDTALPSAAKAVRTLAADYDVHFVCGAPSADDGYVAGVQRWLADNIGVLAWDHLTATNRKDLLYGDWLIDSRATARSEDFAGTRIELGSDTYKTWDDILQFYARLRGRA